VRGRVVLAVAAFALLAAGTAAPDEQDEALWARLRGGGQVVMIRHAATEPGIGDPPGYRLDDCATQRNLSPAGREESRRLGAAFRARQIPIRRVLSSRWCRCLETARLAFGTVEPWPPLDSFFGDRSREQVQAGAVRTLISQAPGGGNLILVTHQVNITALTGLHASPGEIIVISPIGNGTFRIAGRLTPVPSSY
jgi:phosphohistidine phosphatase SixA